MHAPPFERRLHSSSDALRCPLTTKNSFVFMSLESLWRLLLVGKGVAKMIGRFVVDDTFFFRSFLFPLLEIHMGHSKVQRCPLIY
jgi:hypothetical protein